MATQFSQPSQTTAPRVLLQAACLSLQAAASMLGEKTPMDGGSMQAPSPLLKTIEELLKQANEVPTMGNAAPYEPRALWTPASNSEPLRPKRAILSEAELCASLHLAPSPPTVSKPLPFRRTKEDRPFLHAFARWAYTHNPRLTTVSLSRLLALKAPYRGIDSWKYVATESLGILNAIKDVVQRYNPDGSLKQTDTDSEEGGASDRGGRRRSHPGTMANNRPTRFTERDKHHMARYISSYPGVWEQPGEAYSAWTRFAQMHPERSQHAWVNLYRYRGYREEIDDLAQMYKDGFLIDNERQSSCKSYAMVKTEQVIDLTGDESDEDGDN